MLPPITLNAWNSGESSQHTAHPMSTTSIELDAIALVSTSFDTVKRKTASFMPIMANGTRRFTVVVTRSAVPYSSVVRKYV